jgi:hypothetical protein
MATANATLFPVRGQAFQCGAVIYSSSTANPLTGGLTALALTISKDGGAFATAAGTVTEIGTSGYVVINLTAVDTAANQIDVLVTASNANAVYATLEIKTWNVAELTGHWLAQAVIRPEQGWLQGVSYLINRVTRNLLSGLLTLRNYNNTATIGTMEATEVGGDEVKGQLT